MKHVFAKQRNCRHREKSVHVQSHVCEMVSPCFGRQQGYVEDTGRYIKIRLVRFKLDFKGCWPLSCEIWTLPSEDEGRPWVFENYYTFAVIFVNDVEKYGWNWCYVLLDHTIVLIWFLDELFDSHNELQTWKCTLTLLRSLCFDTTLRIE